MSRQIDIITFVISNTDKDGQQSPPPPSLDSIYFMIGSMLIYLPYTLKYINFSSTNNITFTCMVKARSLAISILVTFENLLILI